MPAFAVLATVENQPGILFGLTKVLAVELGGVALGGAHDDLGVDRAAGGGQLARADLLDGGVFQDPRTGGVGGTGDGVREPQGMNGRARAGTAPAALPAGRVP